jgi:uncharacterized protein
VIGIFLIGSSVEAPLRAANSEMPDGIPDSKNALVYDGAGILSSSEVELLTSQLTEVNAKHDVKLAIATTQSTGERTDKEFADDYYDYNGYSEDGVLLLINMDPKGWYISAKGQDSQHLPDSSKEKIGGKIRPDLSEGNYYTAFEKFINMADEFLTPD